MFVKELYFIKLRIFTFGTLKSLWPETIALYSSRKFESFAFSRHFIFSLYLSSHLFP